MSGHTDIIGARIAIAAQKYAELVDAVKRLDGAKSLHPKGSALAAVGQEVSDHADMYVMERYINAMDTLNAWISSTASMMRRVAIELEKAKPDAEQP